MSDLEDEIIRYQRAAEELREQIKLAHAATRDLKSARQSLLDLRRQWLDGKDFDEKIGEVFGPALNSGLDDVLKGLKQTEAAALKRFDEVIMICLGEDPITVQDGKQTVIDLVKDFVLSRRLPVHLTVYAHLMMNAKTKTKQEAKNARSVRNATGREFGELPILLDERMKDDMGLLYLPRYDDGNPAQFLINFRTGEGIAQAVKAAREVQKRDTESVPAAFRKPGQILPESVRIEPKKEGTEPA